MHGQTRSVHKTAHSSETCTRDVGTWKVGANETLHGSHGQQHCEASFYKAVIAIHDGRLEAARGHVNRSRMLIADGLTPLLAESYNRAYPSMVMVRSFEL